MKCSISMAIGVLPAPRPDARFAILPMTVLSPIWITKPTPLPVNQNNCNLIRDHDNYKETSAYLSICFLQLKGLVDPIFLAVSVHRCVFPTFTKILYRNEGRIEAINIKITTFEIQRFNPTFFGSVVDRN